MQQVADSVIHTATYPEDGHKLLKEAAQKLACAAIEEYSGDTLDAALELVKALANMAWCLKNAQSR